MDKEYLKNKKYKEITKSMFQIQEEERNRIARDLHDTSLHDLTYILHKLELLGMDLENNPEKAGNDLIEIKKYLKTTIKNIRNIIFDLRPTVIDDLGLKESLNVFSEWLRNNSKISYVFDIDEIESNKIVQLNIYRIIVECVLNSIKYSECTEIIVKCKIRNEHIYLLIEDNGKGFDIDKNNNRLSYGLYVIKERVNIMDGEINYDVNIGKGSKIQIYIPL